MKRLFTLLFVFALTGLLNAQTTHQVTVQSNTFTPANLTIEEGDIVEWTNIGGSHNVNGTTVSFPSNPEGFGNSVGTGWTYEFTFSTAGTYDYQCDPHQSFGMTGTITVEEAIANGVAEISNADFSVYPNPNAGDFNIVNKGQTGNYIIDLIDVTGKVVYSEQLQLNNNERTEINASDVTTGIYLVKMTNTEANYYRTIRMVIK